jgi:hypothetical protein
MFTISEGFTTGVARYTPNKYQLLNNTVIDATIAEYSGKGTTMNVDDASVECTRKECDVFVRDERDGATTYYQMTDLPYEVDKYQDQVASEQKVDVVLTDDRKKESLIPQPPKGLLEPTIYIKKEDDYKTRNIIIILVFISLIVLVIYFSADKKGSPLYEHRPSTADECGVLV